MIQPNMLLGNMRNALALGHPNMAQLSAASLDQYITDGGALPDDWVKRLAVLLVAAIKEWMETDTQHQQWAHGNAQGIARSIAYLRQTSFTDAWEAGLNNYQNSITQPDRELQL